MPTPTFDPSKPFNDLPRLPPKAELETRAVLKGCIRARAALAELKATGDLIPNQAILINTIPLLEARASSEIENIVTTADRLFRFAQETDSQADPATREALRYRTALHQGYRSLAKRPLSTATAVEVCRTIRGVDSGIRKVPGTALTNQATGKVIYTPPDGEARLRDLLANWERYLHEETDVDPVIRMAVGHYQFEAIHPFTDGNGRTGRVLNLLFLVDQGLLTQPTLYLSRAIIRTKAEYYRRLNAVTTKGQWAEWTAYMVSTVEETATWTTAKIRSVKSLMDATTEHVKRQAPKLYSRELVELVFTQPYCRISNLVDAGIAKRQAASEYLKELSEVGVLNEMKVGREKLFINPRLMKLLTAEDHEVPTFPARTASR
ncbi:MAG: Fic family protein [Acidobacteriota bacterium]